MENGRLRQLIGSDNKRSQREGGHTTTLGALFEDSQRDGMGYDDDVMSVMSFSTAMSGAEPAPSVRTLVGTGTSTRTLVGVGDSSVTREREQNMKPSQDYIKRFWMSDKNCSLCSECGATFHTFRRKHHCRLCGRVFCQTCCSERVNINKFKKLKSQYFNDDEKSSGGSSNSGGMMRVCIFCSKLKTGDPLLGIALSYPNSVSFKKLEALSKGYDSSIHSVYDGHIENVIRRLCRFEKLDVGWERLIVSYCKMANDRVFPDILSSAHDLNDIRHYVKVKRICGGSISECRFVDGVMFRKNVAHRKMRSDIISPRILLLDEAIEYHRMNSKLHCFDILLKQNEEYCRMIVNKVVDLGPDIVVVSNQVSRLALNEMVKEDITLVCNVESSTMERIARAIGAPIIGSIDHINQLDAKYALGRCGRFHVEYYNEDPVGNKGRRTPLMIFDDCPAGRHATILLRGDNKLALLKVKNVIRLAMHSQYHANLEKSLLANLCTFIPKKYRMSYYEQIQSDNEAVSFISTSPYVEHHGWKRETVINKLKRLHANKEHDRFPHLVCFLCFLSFIFVCNSAL